MSDALTNERLEAEVLSSVLIDPRVLEDISAIVGPSDFATPVGRLVMQAYLDLQAAGSAIDEVTLAGALPGGVAIVGGLMKRSGQSRNAGHYAALVLDRSRRRQLVRIAGDIEHYAGEDEDWEAIAARSMAAVEGVATGRDVGFDALLPKHAIKRALTPREGGGHLPTGFAAVDAATGGGLPRGEPTIVGGRQGMGKSAWCVAAAVNAAVSGGRVLVFTPELPLETYWQRMLGYRPGLPRSVVDQQVRAQTLAPLLIDSADQLSAAKLVVDDRSNPSAVHIERRCRGAVKHWGGLDLVVIDYWQLLDHPNPDPRRPHLGEARTAQRLRVLSKDLRCALLVVTQLNKSGAGKVPEVSDLRECDALADIGALVLFPVRPWEWGARAFGDPPVSIGREDAYTMVAKGRDTHTGLVAQRWNTRAARWE